MVSSFLEEPATPKQWIMRGFAGVIGLFIFATILSSFVVIGTGQRGVITRFGAVQDRILDEGFHLKTPWIEDVTKMDVSVQKAERDADSASKDLQSIYTTVAINYHFDPLKVTSIYQNFRNNVATILIEPSIQEAVKASTSKFTAEELVTNRTSSRDEIVTSLKTSLEPYGIIIDGVSIVNFKFSEAFDLAIEAKVTAEQNALAAENKLRQIQAEADQTVVKAKAEAESIKIQAESISAQGGAEYVKLKWIEKWDGTLPATMLNGAADILLGL